VRIRPKERGTIFLFCSYGLTNEFVSVTSSGVNTPRVDLRKELARVGKATLSVLRLSMISFRVKKGDVVSIAPLLKLMEDRLRVQVERKTKPFTGTFDPTWQPISPDSKTLLEYTGKSDCEEAGVLVYARALIRVFGLQQFDQGRKPRSISNRSVRGAFTYQEIQSPGV